MSHETSIDKLKLIPATMMLSLGLTACTGGSETTAYVAEPVNAAPATPDKFQDRLAAEQKVEITGLEAKYGSIGGFKFDVASVLTPNRDGTRNTKAYLKAACTIADNVNNTYDPRSVAKESPDVIANYVALLSDQYSMREVGSSEAGLHYATQFHELLDECLVTLPQSEERTQLVQKYSRPFHG